MIKVRCRSKDLSHIKIERAAIIFLIRESTKQLPMSNQVEIEENTQEREVIARVRVETTINSMIEEAMREGVVMREEVEITDRELTIKIETGNHIIREEEIRRRDIRREMTISSHIIMVVIEIDFKRGMSREEVLSIEGLIKEMIIREMTIIRETQGISSKTEKEVVVTEITIEVIIMTEEGVIGVISEAGAEEATDSKGVVASEEVIGAGA